jgi:choline kinase
MGRWTKDAPKCLTRLNGMALLDRQLAALRGAGISKIAIVTGYLGSQIRRQGATILENKRWRETNMVSSLLCASSWLARAECIVSYADIFYESKLVRCLLEFRGMAVIAFDPNWRALWSRRFSDPLGDAETFSLDDRGYLLDIGRRPRSYAEVNGQYTGLFKIAPRGWNQIRAYLRELAPEAVDRLDMTTLLGALIARDCRIAAVPVCGPWGEVDSDADLRLYQDMISSGELLISGETRAAGADHGS